MLVRLFFTECCKGYFFNWKDAANVKIVFSRCKDLTELALFGCKSVTNKVVEKMVESGQNLTILTLPDKIKPSGLEKVHFNFSF